MNKSPIRIILAAMLVGMAVYHASGVEVATTAIKVLPERNLKYADVWESSTVVDQGAIMKWGNNFYMAEIFGTLGTNAPTFRSGVETNGTVTLRYIERGPRRGFVIQLHDAGPVWVKAYTAPGVDDGFKLSGSLAHWSERGDGCPQGAIWVASESGTNTITGSEW